MINGCELRQEKVDECTNTIFDLLEHEDYTISEFALGCLYAVVTSSNVAKRIYGDDALAESLGEEYATLYPGSE